jgi:hypothetical protein
LGYISYLAANSRPNINTQRFIGVGQNPGHVREAVEAGRASWHQMFSTNKEESSFAKEGYKRPSPGGSYGRSALSSDASMIRLLQSMRSMAPGGWS